MNKAQNIDEVATLGRKEKKESVHLISTPKASLLECLATSQLCHRLLNKTSKCSLGETFKT